MFGAWAVLVYGPGDKFLPGAAFPGSSGGGVYLTDGRYVGMIVRGAGETFNLTVPIRRMREWAKRMGVEFTLDPSLKVPT